MPQTTPWWLVAVALCALSAALSSVGTILQKLAWVRARAATVAGDEARAWPFWRLWLAGFALMAAGAGPSVLALSFASQSELAPLGSLGLAINMWLSHGMLGETLTRRDAAATAIIVAGCALSVVFAAHHEPVLDLDELLALYGRPRFVVYACVSGVLLLTCAAALAALDRQAVADAGRYAQLYKLHRFLYPFAAALVSAQSTLLAKSLAELLLTDAEGGGARFLHRWQPYCMLVCLIGTVTLHLFWFNCALARFDALYVVPVAQGAGVVLGVTGGGVLYGEFEAFSARQAVAFAAGVALIGAGLWTLSWRSGDAQPKPAPAIAAADGARDSEAALDECDDALSRRSSLSTALLETPLLP